MVNPRNPTIPGIFSLFMVDYFYPFRHPDTSIRRKDAVFSGNREKIDIHNSIPIS